MLTTKLWLGTPRLFLTGSAMVTAGVLLHLPMFISARDMHYQMNGMPWDAQMVIGMVLIAVGSILALGGLIKPSSGPRKSLARMRISAEDDDKTARLGAAHYKLIAVMIFAIAIDTQKPFTLTFIIPSAAKEYALSTPAHLIAGAPTVAWLPFTGILGTTIGSFLWGYLGDRIGRRSSLLFAAVMFVGTSVCGAMPSYGWNVAMCLLMGIGAGGMLPAAYTLLAETTPARLRGAVLVLVGGVGTALGFLFASWMATWLLPILGWRVLWFAGMPTGILLLACSRLVPESPRFLLLHDRTAEATAVLRRFGQRLITVDDKASAHDDGADRRVPAGSFGRLFQRPFGPVTAGLVICGLAWGMVNFGFLTWLPSTIGSIGISATQITGLLAKAALFAVPGALAVAWLYARWSTRRTMVVSALITGATLVTFAAIAGTVLPARGVLLALIVVLLIGIWAVIAVLSPYSAEIYPTTVRTRGSAITAGASKLGGVLALGMSVSGIAPPGVAMSAALAAIPMLLGAAVLAVVAVETKGRQLETITLTPAMSRR